MSRNAKAPYLTVDEEGALARAAHPYSAFPRPFLRWPGSKRHLLPHLASVLPQKFRAYHEPFLGSAALFFLLQPKNAFLADTIPDLITSYRAVRDHPSQVLQRLSRIPLSSAAYYRIRRSTSNESVRIATRFIYLNKTCWNGVYRVNSSGIFNVPYGSPQTKPLVDPKNLHACSRLLRSRGVKLRVADFASVLDRAESGDLVYLDPPYVAAHSNNGFRDYNETLFSWADQERLAQTAATLLARRVHVIVTNADHPSIRSLYPDFRGHAIRRSSTLAADPSRRGPTTELILIPKS